MTALRRNVLIFHSGALGDFLLTWPLALALGRLYPQSRIFYVTQAGKGKLAERWLRVESIDIEGGWHHLFRRDGEPPPAIVASLARCHSIYSFVATAHSEWADNIRRYAPESAAVYLAQSAPPDFPGHVTEYLLHQLAGFPAVEEALRQMLRWIGTSGVPSGSPESRLGVVLHPGSGSTHKNWPVERFAELGKKLSRERGPVRIVLGEVEQERWGREILDVLASAGSLERPASLLELGEIIAASGLFVGNDSGPGHLACLLGVPTVSIFGPTDPIRWCPIGPRRCAMRGSPIEDLQVGQVYAEVQRVLWSGAGELIDS